MEKVTDFSLCTGCSACANVCPKKAIKIIQDAKGFYKHCINQEECINCGLCTKVCPNNHFNCQNTFSPECFAVMNSDEIRMKSSSGGVFSAIAENILDKGGVVCGAAFDDDWSVKHVIVESSEGLEKLRGSKYAQSFISEELFKNIEEHLKNNRYVLFVGVPCQVAGLINYLRKDYEKLYTIDMICAYAPSSEVFKQFINENYNKEDILDIRFRDKQKLGWSASHNTIVTKENTYNDDRYMRPYLDRRFKGEHCVNCNYKKFPRPGDFTMGDFWKIQEFAKDCDDKKGTSGLLLNNAKAKKLFEEIKGNFKLLKPMPLEALGWQIDVKHKIPQTPECKLFFKNRTTMPFNENVPYSAKFAKVGITNWWFINNRGAVLTNYALNEMVNELGYNAYTINYITPFERGNFFSRGYVKSFTDKYIKRTRWIEHRHELQQLNADIGTFICGSDQIFNYSPCKSHSYLYYMDWVDAKKNKLISYAASFAINQFKATESQTNFVKHLLKRFDFHSIREQTGVDIMKNTFGLDSTLILDPVFCIDKQKYIDIANTSTIKTDEDFIVYYYTVPNRCENEKLLKHFKDKTGIKKAINLFDWNMPMEDWLWYFINAKFVLTNSFHGACFSLIFNKAWAAFVLDGQTDSRFDTIAQLSHQENRIFYNVDEMYQADYLFDGVDFSYYNSSIQEKIKASILWLKNALDTAKQNHLSATDDFYDALINDYNEKIHLLGKQYSSENADLQRRISQQNQLILEIVPQGSISRKHKMYRLLKHLSWGKRKNHYKNLCKKYKNLYKMMSGVQN